MMSCCHVRVQKFGLVVKKEEIARARGDNGKFSRYVAKLYKVEKGSDIKLQRENGIW